MNIQEIYTFYYPKDYKDLVENISYSLKKIDVHLSKKSFRNKCSKQSLRICIRIAEKKNLKRIDLLFRLILMYHKYWC